MMRSIEAWEPRFQNTYRLVFHYENNETQTIHILNSDFIKLNNDIYKVLGNPNFSSIYETIILDQPKGTLDKLYYDWINTN